MSEENDSTHKSWLSRLATAIHREPHSRDELLDLLYTAKDRQILNNDEFIMIKGVLQVAEIHVRDIMVPRGQMVVLEYDATPEKVIPLVIESTHSRFPVIGENRDEVLGILLAKDLLTYFNKKERPHTQIQELVRPAVFVPESKRVDSLLREFRINRYHMAIVVDEYGGVSGLVTIEDVLEQIVGNIMDETDVAVEEPDIKKIAPETYHIKAQTPIDEFNEYFNTDISDDDFDTIGGFVTQKLGHMPRRGEKIEFDSFTIEVIAATKRRLQLLRLKQSSQ